jgi:hypothetical protein
MIFPADLKKIVKIDSVSNAVIKDLPQLYRSDLDFAKSFDNKTINDILIHLPYHPEFKHVSIDSRSHMLMKGMYPCIPGWHCDDFYRESHEHQPDLANIPPTIHYLVVLGDCSRTEFAATDLNLPDPTELPADKP